MLKRMWTRVSVGGVLSGWGMGRGEASVLYSGVLKIHHDPEKGAFLKYSNVLKFLAKSNILASEGQYNSSRIMPLGKIQRRPPSLNIHDLFERTALFRL